METPALLTQHVFPPPLLSLLSTLHQAGHETFIVGGALRDILIGRAVIDYDVATAATPPELAALFPTPDVVSGSFGNTTVIIETKCFELTTFRKESGYHDHRHPDTVNFVSSYADDWVRRDITINALAYNPTTGEFFDPADGLADIDKKLIRTIGDSIIRFEEDALRMLRAIRLAAECTFFIESRTLTAITPERFSKATISNEQIDHELNKLLKSSSPDVGVYYLKETHLLDNVYPQIQDYPDDELERLRTIPSWRERRRLLL